MRKLLTILLFTPVSGFCQTHYPIGNMLGVNLRGDNITGSVGQGDSLRNVETKRKQQAIINTGIKGLRIYVDATTAKSNDNSAYRLNPDGRGYQTDSAIIMLRKSIPNLFVNIAYQNQPVSIQQEWTGVKSSIYRHINADPNLSSSYSDIAHDCGVLSARGGSNPNVPDYPLFVSPNWWENVGSYYQAQFKGARLYNSIAGGNEWDNNWTNDRYVNGAQYAAAWKAIYDSIKKYDPNMIVSTTGVMTQEPNILNDAIAWCNTYNGGKLPFDEYEFHCYPWGWYKNIASALSPELTIIPACKKMVSTFPNVSFVVGEWSAGDRAQYSDMGIMPFGGHTGEEIQGYWTTRGILGMAATGIKRAFNYQAYQAYGHINDNNGESFVTSSLYIEENDGTITRYKAGDAIYNLSQYADYVWDKTFIDNDSVKVYRFKAGTNYLYTGWTVEKVQLVTINGVNRAQLTERKINYTFPDGQTKQLSSNPLTFVASAALPIDTTSKPKPHGHKKYTIDVYDFMGNKVVTKYGEVEQVKASLPRRKYFILKYHNDTEFLTEKIFKQ